ncbi:MAG: hypothetical protein IPN55_04495 [Saprospiraceae bacterium]|nr:hypothetical protein [Candidatus Brachybacter algidus]
MKQFIFAILVITVFNANIFAQDSNEDLRERFSIGIKAGGNYLMFMMNKVIIL